MTDEQFAALVQRLEPEATHRPGQYKFRVLLLAMLGNAYLAAILGLIVAVLFGLFASVMVLKALAVKLIIVVGFFLWMVLRALWVRIEPPAGQVVTAQQAPALFAMIEELRRQLAAPAFHHVLVTHEFNAGVVQSPGLGIFGWPRNYLLLGLPLMQALSEAQFKAVLAHEFGHLAGGHGRLSNWIYRQRLRWSRLLAMLDAAQSNGGFLFKPFLNWFSPYFNAYSFPLARANEYEADATAARLTSPQAAAQALTAVNVVACYLEERYWPGIHRQADALPHPAFAPYAGFRNELGAGLDAAAAADWLAQSLARSTSLADTHPALGDRLAALKVPASLELPMPGEAADSLLGTAREALTRTFDQQWERAIADAWQERYRAAQEERQRLVELDERQAAGAELSVAERFERALLTESAGKDPAAGLAQLAALHAAEPAHAPTALALGARLLAGDDPAGSELVEQAMQRDESTIISGCEILRDYHWRNGRGDEAKGWHQRLVERQGLLEAARLEREQVLLKEKFDRHGLGDAELARLRQQLRAIPGLGKVYLVRKRVRHFPEWSCHVLGYRARGLFRFQRKRREAALLQQIQDGVEFPGGTLIISVDGDNYRFARKFAWMRGTRII